MALPTLIVVDVQQALDDPRWGERNNPQFEENLAAALAGWREAGAPIIHVRHESLPGDGGSGLFVRGTSGFDYKPEAQPLDGEPEIVKNVNSAFIGTDLEERLRADGVASVAIAGLTTDHCCATTARMSGNLGFDTWILGDAMATHPRTGPGGEQISADVMHLTALASLNGEFGEVVDVGAALARLRSASPS